MAACKVWRFTRCLFRYVPAWEMGQTIFYPAPETGGLFLEVNAQVRTDDPDKRDWFGYPATHEGFVQMSVEHELLHSWIAERQGLPYSPTLYALATHPDGDFRRPPACASVREQQWEEGLVRDFARFLHTGHRTGRVDDFADASGLRPEEARSLAGLFRSFLLYPEPSDTDLPL